jgi:hypothetical protein
VKWCLFNSFKGKQIYVIDLENDAEIVQKPQKMADFYCFASNIALNFILV